MLVDQWLNQIKNIITMSENKEGEKEFAKQPPPEERESRQQDESPEGAEQQQGEQPIAKHVARNNKLAAGLLLVFEMLFIVLHGVFSRPEGFVSTVDYSLAPVAGIAILLLVGFGLYFSYLKFLFWSGMGFTLLITAFTFQAYFVINALFSRMNLQGGWDNVNDVRIPIFLNEQDGQTSTGGTHTYGLTAVNGLRCSMATTIAFMAIGGRAGPAEAIFVAIIGTILFEVNRQTQTLYAQVTGSSNFVFTFAGFMGGILSILLAKFKQGDKINDHPGYKSNKINITMSLFGSGLIFVFFPLLSMDVPASLFIFSNAAISTYFSMACTVMSVIAFDLIVEGKLSFRDIIMAPIAGGIIVSSASVYIYNPLQSLVLGFISGLVLFILNRFERHTGNQPLSTHAVFTLFGVQGIIGSWASAIMRAINRTAETWGTAYDSLPSKYVYSQDGETAAAFVSAGIGLAAGVIAFLIVYFVNGEHRSHLYQDKTYWMIRSDSISLRRQGTGARQAEEGEEGYDEEDEEGIQIEISGAAEDESDHAYL